MAATGDSAGPRDAFAVLGANNSNMKNILIVGATSAIAAACARRWAAQGARLFLVARNGERLQQVAADLTARIFSGAKPGDLPFEEPTKYLLVVNLKMAKASGIDLPTNFLALADEVIE